MSDAPSDVFHEILLRVPAESLLRFRVVCKAWRRIIDNPSFVKAHTDNQLLSTNFIVKSHIDSRRFESLSLDSIDFADACQTVEVSPVKPLISRGVPKTPEILPVPSCNGLMLLTHIDPKMSWVIWNPFTRDFHRLSALDVDVNSRVLGIGLGYDSATADYKVVRIDGFYRTLVYSLKLGSWKMIKNCPYCFPWIRVRDNPGIFLNGSLHWRSYNMIIALDLVNEDYYQLPLPQELTRLKRRPRDHNVHLDAFSGNLVLSYYQTEDSFVGWVMEDCKVEKSWRKLFSFDAIGVLLPLRPAAYLKNKGHVVLQNLDKFFLLDIEKDAAKKVSIAGLPNCFTCQNCVKSILKLDQSYDVCRRVTRKRTRAQRNKFNASVTQPATITSFRFRF